MLNWCPKLTSAIQQWMTGLHDKTVIPAGFRTGRWFLDRGPGSPHWPLASTVCRNSPRYNSIIYFNSPLDRMNDWAKGVAQSRNQMGSSSHSLLFASPSPPIGENRLVSTPLRSERLAPPAPIGSEHTGRRVGEVRASFVGGVERAHRARFRID